MRPETIWSGSPRHTAEAVDPEAIAGASRCTVRRLPLPPIHSHSRVCGNWLLPESTLFGGAMRRIHL